MKIMNIDLKFCGLTMQFLFNFEINEFALKT